MVACTCACILMFINKDYLQTFIHMDYNSFRNQEDVITEFKAIVDEGLCNIQFACEEEQL